MPTPKPMLEENNIRQERIGGWGNKSMPGRPYKQLTSKESEEKRNKGLCYLCDESMYWDINTKRNNYKIC